MADEKILKDNSSKDEKISNDELLNDEQLDNVAGGVNPIFASYNIIEPNDTQNQPPQFESRHTRL